jgi:PAS domain S-box-containing protein
MLDFLSKLLDTSDFPARWDCGNWTAGHGWLHILSDLGVWSAYFAIPCILVYFVLRRRDVPFPSVFWLFGAFILACGTTHLMEAILFWHPLYRLAGVIKVLTALVSWATVAALVPVLPKALALPSPDQLEREISTRKQIESALEQANADQQRQLEALRASEERFRLLVDGAKDHAIFMLDPTGRVISWNPGAERIKQYQAEEIVGQDFSRFYPQEDVQAGKPEEELRVAAALGRYEDEGWRLRKDGSRFWANVVITALRDEGGKLRGFSKITRDMTERKQAEENARRLLEETAARRAAEEHAAAIWEERERLRVTLHSIGDGVIATDADGRVTLLNPVAQALTGWESAQAAGQPLQEIFPIINELTRHEAENPVAKVFREGTVVGLANHTVLMARDGTERPITDSAAPIRHADGTIAGVVLVFRDATDQRRAEEAARKNREIFQLVHQIGKIGHWEWNSLTNENKWSPEIEALYGLPPGGFEGGYQGWAKLVHPDDLPKAEEDVRRTLQTGEYFTEFRVIWPDGSVHWLETRAYVFKDGHDKPVRIVGVNMDVTERKRQEEALQQSERRLAAELDAMTRLHSLSARLLSADNLTKALDDVLENAIETCAADLGNIQLYNPQTDALEIVAQRGFRQDFLDYFRLVRVDEGSACAQALQSGERIIIEDVDFDPSCEPHRRIAAAAGYRGVQSTPMKSRNGSVVGMLSTHFRQPHRPSERDQRLLDLLAGHAADLMERLGFEAALRQSEAQFRQLADAMPQIVWTARPDGYLDYYNERWYEYTGFPRGEYGQQSWEPILHPDDVQRCVDTYFGCIKAEKPYQIEYRFKDRKTGGYRWFLGRAVPVWDEQGRIVRWFGTCTDIDDTKKAGERLRLLWEAASVLLTTTEPDVMLRELFAKIGPHLSLDAYFNYMVNETGDALRLVSFIGIPEETARQISRLEFGQAISGTVALVRQPIVATHIQQSDDPKVQLVKSFGIRAYVCNPLKSSSDLLGTFSFASRSRDQFDEDDLEFLRTICHYVAVAYERLRLIRQLRNADRRKDEFLATLAHELRNPLAPLRNAVEFLRSCQGDGALIEKARNIIGRQVDLMVRLIDELLDVGRISQGKVRLRKERVELQAVVRSALEAVEPLMQAQAHELMVTLPPEVITLDGDSTRLAQIISNLLNNAAKYTERGGHIWLTAERRGNEAVVSVRDTGIGIAAEHLPHLFEMFSQIAPALERSQGGLGIGLSLVRGLVELHGGRVEARSKGPGKGSEFIVRLPVADVPIVQESRQPAEDNKEASSRKRRILVVDDNRDAADSLALMLQMMGHDTRTAYDGAEAVQAAESFRPEVVLLDIGLPKMNGYEVAGRIRQQPWGASVTLIALTGWGQDEDKRRASEAGFDHHLTKPVEAASLREKVSGPFKKGS